jgi:multidrug efflux pump subunit AcrA (membrane-fusion protein)
VPAAAIVKRDGSDVAFAVVDTDDEGGTVEQRTLELGRTLGDDREVTSGLAGGEKVVLEPAADLQDGTRVRLAQPPTD